MAAVLIQRCANGYIAAPANSNDVSQAHIIADTVMSDPQAALTFMQWVEKTTGEPSPADVRSKLQAARNELDGPGALAGAVGGPTQDPTP